MSCTILFANPVLDTALNFNLSIEVNFTELHTVDIHSQTTGRLCHLSDGLHQVLDTTVPMTTIYIHTGLHLLFIHSLKVYSDLHT